LQRRRQLAEYHHVAANKGEAACLALQRGLVAELPVTDCCGKPLQEMIEVGRIDLAVLDQALLHVLTLKFRLR